MTEWTGSVPPNWRSWKRLQRKAWAEACAHIKKRGSRGWRRHLRKRAA